LTAVTCLFVILPHFIWLFKNNFPSVHHALTAARAGTLGTIFSDPLLVTLVSPYLEVCLFVFGILIFFRRFISRANGGNNPALQFFRWMALYGLILPVIVVLTLQTGHFTVRWFAPIYISIPLAGYSMISMRERCKTFQYFGMLCVCMACAVLAIRVFIGFTPDTVGKVERIHIPYSALSMKLDGVLREKGTHAMHGLAVIADDNDRFLAANIIAHLPGTQFVSLKTLNENRSIRENVSRTGGLILWNRSKSGASIPQMYMNLFPSAEPVYLEAPYLHSQKHPPYILGAAIIPRLLIDRP
jgi:hypothetical protein